MLVDSLHGANAAHIDRSSQTHRNSDHAIMRIALASFLALLLAACGGSGSGSGSDSGSDSGSAGGDVTVATDSGAITFTFTPADRTNDVPTQPVIEIEADTELDATSVNGDSVYIEGPNGPIAASVEYAQATIILTPDAALPADRDFTIRVTSDVATADGQAIQGAAYSSFRTLSLGAQPPALAQWEEDMVTYGKQWGEAIRNENNYSTQLPMHYYDARRIHLQIADYTGDAEPWESYARAAGDVYDRYLRDNDFGTAGYMRFPHGLFIDWERNNNSTARNYLIRMRDNGAFSNPDTNNWADSWYRQRYSREVAYALQNHMLAERAGEPRQTERVNLYADMALAHVEIWTTGNFIHSDSNWQFVQAFMAGLTASALIEYYERSVEIGSPDERVPEALETLADWLWDNMWVADVNGTGYGAFSHVTPRVVGVGSESPSPDLSLLIAPMYGWLYRETGASRFLERGDAVFEGGVMLADLGGAKRFNQNYRNSFEYVEWRAEGYALHGN